MFPQHEKRTWSRWLCIQSEVWQWNCKVRVWRLSWWIKVCIYLQLQWPDLNLNTCQEGFHCQEIFISIQRLNFYDSIKSVSSSSAKDLQLSSFNNRGGLTSPFLPVGLFVYLFFIHFISLTSALLVKIPHKQFEAVTSALWLCLKSQHDLWRQSAKRRHEICCGRQDEAKNRCVTGLVTLTNRPLSLE